MWYYFSGRSIITKKGDGSQVKESTDSSTTLEDDDVKGNNNNLQTSREMSKALYFSVSSDTTSLILYPTYLSNSVKNIKGLLNGVTIH